MEEEHKTFEVGPTVYVNQIKSVLDIETNDLHQNYCYGEDLVTVKEEAVEVSGTNIQAPNDFLFEMVEVPIKNEQMTFNEDSETGVIRNNVVNENSYGLKEDSVTYNEKCYESTQHEHSNYVFIKEETVDIDQKIQTSCNAELEVVNFKNVIKQEETKYVTSDSKENTLRSDVITCAGEKPIKYSFDGAGNMSQTHLRTFDDQFHAGEKPFKCNICDFRSADKSYLGCHLKNHTADKRYKCDICEYSCTVKGRLQKHIKTHTDEKPFLQFP